MTTLAPPRRRAAVVAPAPAAIRTGRLLRSPALAGAVLVVLALGVSSLFVGVSELSLADVASGLGAEQVQTLVVSRVPRTLSIVLAGSAMAVVGLVMQLLVRNKFVEPSTAGTTESAVLGLLVVTIVAPGLPLVGKMGVAAVFALAGTALFLGILRRIRLRSVVVVPLVGLMLSGVVGAVSTFVAYRAGLLQAVSSWTTGDFSGMVRGRYELLWVVGACAVVAYLAANRFTVAGLGEEFTTNLGLSYRRVLALGLAIVAVTSAVVVVVVGALPFLGLVVPNLVSLAMGDYLRRSLPWVALAGAGFVLVCDLIGRLVIFPAEIPIGVVVGVVGAGLFLYLLLRRPADAR
ncbi:ABC transporter permease [Georgenia sp. AZ-5]|uniref:ABC transporter permease n=1 Tax=Georgenia sp. AZ-5 TaxID=3367526 RepID=UPI00375533D1